MKPAWADEFMKKCEDVMKAVSSMGNPSTMGDDEEDVPPKKKEDKVDDAGAYDAEAMDARLSKIEDAIAALQGKAGDEEADDEEMDDAEMDDEEMDDAEGEESEDEEAEMVGDAKSKMEILAPGLKAKGKDAKAQALKACYKTKDGKAVIDSLTGGKPLDYKQEVFVGVVFDAAAELLKTKRSKSLRQISSRCGSRWSL